METEKELVRELRDKLIEVSAICNKMAKEGISLKLSGKSSYGDVYAINKPVYFTVESAEKIVSL